jgi:uncharacterized protein YciI
MELEHPPAEPAKRCPNCGHVKSTAEFPRNRASKDGLATYCKPCHNERMKEISDRLYGGHANYLRRKRYGIDEAGVRALLDAQGGVCAICGAEGPTHVDHDHETGRSGASSASPATGAWARSRTTWRFSAARCGTSPAGRRSVEARGGEASARPTCCTLSPGPEGQRARGERRVKYVVFYESAPDVAARAAPHLAAHVERFREFHARGVLLMIGTFANPQSEGSMAIFTTRKAAEEFIAGDPFVLNGVVARWQIREWNEALVEP